MSGSGGYKKLEHELSEVRGDEYPLRDGVVSKLGQSSARTYHQLNVHVKEPTSTAKSLKFLIRAARVVFKPTES